LAGEPIANGRWTKKRKQTLLDSRVRGSDNLIRSLKAADVIPRVFIGTSAVGYYGYSETETAEESTPPGEDFVSRLCVEWEKSQERAKELGPNVRCVQFRLGIALGEGGGFLNRLVPLFQKGLGTILGSGRQRISWIQVEDLLRLYSEALTDESFEGPYNATAANSVTNADLTRQLAAHLKVPLLPSVPAFVLRLLYGEMAEILLKGRAVFSRRLAERDFRWECENFTEALRKSIPVKP
jgi:uncharacterized protein (TIGR01777 family)